MTPMTLDKNPPGTPGIVADRSIWRPGRRSFELALLAAAVVTCGAFLFGGFGEAGSIHLASAFR